MNINTKIAIIIIFFGVAIAGIIVFIRTKQKETFPPVDVQEDSEKYYEPKPTYTELPPEEITDFIEEYSDIPLPKDSVLEKYKPYKPETSTTAQQDEKFTYIAPFSQEETMKFYKNNMSRFGWEIDEIYEDNYHTIFFSKGNKEIFIGVDKKGENQSTITIMISK